MNKNVTSLILIVLAVGIYFTVTSSVMDEVKVLQGVNAQYVSAITGAEKLIKVRDQVRKDFNNISVEDRARLDKMLPNNVDNIRLIIDLNNLAFRHGLVLSGIKASAAQSTQSNTQRGVASAGVSGSSAPVVTTKTSIATPTLDTVTVSFGTTATYEQFLSLLQDLEANLRIMDVTHLALTSTDAGPYEWNIELKTYWLKAQ